MDILDIMLARAMTPQGKIETYVAKANAAATKAAQARDDADAAIATVEAAALEIASAQEEANELLETAREAQLNIPTTEDIDAEIKKLDVSINQIDGTNSKLIQVVTTYPDDTLNTENVTRLYKATGENEDGTMTQKAITDALADKATILYVNNAIANIDIPGGGGSGEGGGNISGDLGEGNEGHIVVVDENGNIKAGDITEEELIEALLRAGIYNAEEAVGLDIDYQGRECARTQQATNLSMGTDFDAYTMYGGRMRCNVADDGTINAFYGDSNYADDGSNGQVMVYQPKFYYQRVPLKVENLTHGQTIRHESIIISAKKQTGFKLHPIFSDGNDGELDYVLFSAYDGAVINDKMSSVANVQPTSGISIDEAEAYATARGTGWHINNMAAESANQMLQIIEYGSMNGQVSLEEGVSNLPYTSGKNCSALTGSTASLGNATGHATTTYSNNNGTTVTNTEAGKRAISYRGLENPWGNLWNFIGGMNIKGDGNSNGGAPYICLDYNYTPSEIGDNYEYIGFNLPSIYGWINAMGYGGTKYDWIFLPSECATTATSLLPVGDNLWTIANVNENKVVVVGGSYTFQQNNGLFYYGCDKDPTIKAINYGSRLMYIPTKGTIYNNNINKWKLKKGE